MRVKAAGRDFGVLAVFALAILFPRFLGAEGKPLVGVELRIEAQDFRRNLYRKIDLVEQDLARSVAKLSADNLGFLAWRPLSEVKDRSQLSAVLHVFLTQEKSSGGVGDTIMLHFSAETGAAGSRFKCAEGALGAVDFRKVKNLDRRLFTPMEPQPTGDAEVLKERIRNELALPQYQVTLGTVFASLIPICHDAEVLRPRLVAICLKQSVLEVDENSKMALSLCTRIPEDKGERRGGSLQLEVAADTGIYPTGNSGTSPQARVSSCVFGDLKDDSCFPKIPLMFQKPLDRSLDVFMLDFSPSDEGTQGNRAVTPWKG